MKLKKFSLLISFGLILSLLLAACGVDDKDKKGSDKAAPEDQQVFNMNIHTEPPTLHPGQATDNVSGAVLDQVFEGLMRVDQKGKVQPGMAESYDLSDDKLTYTFKLREDAKWSNGDPVTAEDFVYAWKWVLNPDSPDTDYAYQLYPIEGAEDAKEKDGSLDDVGVKAKDDHTLEVKLTHPTPYFPELTAFYTFYPVNHKVADDKGKWAQNAGDKYVTNGPFTLDTWKHKDKVILKKNKDYWDADAGKLQTVTMNMIEDENTELELYKSGDLDWAGSPVSALPLPSIDSLKKSGELEVEPYSGIYYYIFNTEEEPFNNKNIRKAFALAIDREALIKNVTKGEQIPAQALVPSTIWKENEKGYFKDNDAKEAKKLLEKGMKEEGWDKLPTPKISYNTSEAHASIAQAIQDMWKKNLDVDAKLNNEEWNVFLDSLGESNYQVARMGWVADFNDPINFLEIYESKGGNNYTNWENKEFAKLLKDARKETDDKKRNQLLRDAEEIYMDEMPTAPIYFNTSVYVKADYVKNIDVNESAKLQLKWAYIAEH